MCSYVMQIRVPDSPGLLDFAIGLVDSNHHLPDGQVKFFWELRASSYDPGYRDGSVSGMNFAVRSYAKFHPGYRDEKW